MKTFMYSFPEVSIKSRMFCIRNSCRSIEDVKKEIALNSNTKSKYILITNPPREEINLIRDYYNFEIKFNTNNHDITISIPGFKTIIIKNGYLLKFEEIFPRIAKEGQYYSEKCIQNNIQLILSGKDVSSKNYPFLSSDNNLTYTIQFQGETVTLKHGEFQFTISNNESFSVAQNLIGKAYPYFNITITDSKGKNPTELKSSEQYQVKVKKFVKFIDVDSNTSTSIQLEFLSTASDAQKLLSTRLKYTNDNTRPEDFFIYNIDRKLIDDLSKPLMFFQDLNQNFFYKIKREKGISQDEKERKPINSIGEKESNNIKEIKTFKYTIRELFFFSELIKVDINQYQTPDDLKSLIASDIKVSDEELQFMNPISEQLKNIPQFTEFKIEFHSLHPDIDVFVSKGQKICIKNLYKMKFLDILNSLANEGIFYSEKCIKRNLHICLLGEEIPPYRFPIFSIPKDAFLEIKFFGKIVTLKYDKFQFTFSDNQTINEARELFQKAFPGLNLSIKDSRGNSAQYLKSTEKYFLRVEKLVSFNDIDDHLSSTNIFIDYFDSVSDFRKKLSEELFINPERIIIYDKNKTPITDKIKPLSSFQNLDQVFSYQIDKEGEISEDKSGIKLIRSRIKAPGKDRESDVEISSQPEKDHKKTSDEDTTSNRYIKIIFIFTKRCGNFYPMREDISLDSTIGDIIEMIKNTHNIKDKINIKANEKMKPFNPKQTIEEIEEFIKDEGNISNIENTLYVDIETKTSKEFQQPDVKRKSKYNEDDEDEKNKLSITTGDWTPKDMKGKLSNPIRKNENPVTKATPEKKETHSERDEFKIETKSSKKSGSSSVSRFKPKVANIPESPDTCKQIKKQVDYSTSESERKPQNCEKICYNKKISKNNEIVGKENKNTNIIEENCFIDLNEEKKFLIIGQINESETSTVFKLIDKTTLKPICKKVLKVEGTTFNDIQNAIKEFQILYYINHPCICKAIGINIHDIIKEKTEKEDEITTVSLFLEYADFTLKDILPNNIITNTLKTRIVVEIAHGMQYIHKKGMIYRDLNIENIMLNAVFQVKLINFGFARVNDYLLGEDMTYSTTLTKGIGLDDFMSPEMMMQKDYDSKTDVYSFGIVIYYIFTGKNPKQNISEKAKGKQITLPKESQSISKDCIELISKCLSFDPKERPSFNEILIYLREHKFMLAPDVDPSIVSVRDEELELINI